MPNVSLLGILVGLIIFGCKADAPAFFKAKDGRYGLKRGNQIIAFPDFHMVTEFKGCCAYVVDDSGWMAITASGEKLFRPFVFDNYPDSIKDNRARFVKNGKVGFYDSSFEIRIPADFTFAWPFEKGLAKFCEGCVQKLDGEHSIHVGGKWGLLDTLGEKVVPACYDDVLGPDMGVISLVQNGDTVKISNPATSSKTGVRHRGCLE
jgi:hypothetical protein